MKALLTTILCVTCYTSHAAELGESTYNIACSTCHSPKYASSIGAPEAFNKKQWKQRFKSAKIAHKNQPERYSSPLDYLLQQVKKGKGLMHHGGLCKESHHDDKNCTDDALMSAIQYMSGRKK